MRKALFLLFSAVLLFGAGSTFLVIYPYVPTDLGGVESLVSLPVLTSQWGHSDDQLNAAGITRGMLRLSVGLEDPQDLIADLDQALAKARTAVPA